MSNIKYLHEYVIHDHQYDRIDFLSSTHEYHKDIQRGLICYTPRSTHISNTDMYQEYPCVKQDCFYAELVLYQHGGYSDAYRVIFRDVDHSEPVHMIHPYGSSGIYYQRLKGVRYLMDSIHVDQLIHQYGIDLRYVIDGYWSLSKWNKRTLIWYRGSDKDHLI